MHRRFGVVEQHEFPDAERCQLAAQLRAYRACGTGNHNRLAAEVGDYLVERNLYLGTTQQILDFDFADGRLHQSAAHDLVYRRGDEYLYVVVGGVFEQAFLFRMRFRFGGEQYGVDVVASAKILHVARTLEIVDAVLGEHVVFQTRSVGQESRHFVVRRVLQTHDKCNRLVARTVNQHTAAIAATLQPVFYQVISDYHHHADHDQRTERKQEIEQQQYRRIPSSDDAAGEHRHAQSQQHLFAESRKHELGDFTQRGVADDKAVCFQHIIQQQREYRRADQPYQCESV